MRRVMVVGGPGSGKTTVTRHLSDSLGLPAIHLDRHFWRAGWETPSVPEWRDQVERLAAADSWVMDGNYSNTFDLRMPRADALIWLNIPRRICLRRVLGRTLIGYGNNRPDLPEGCPERFDLPFLRYIWEFPQKHSPRIVAGIEQFGSHLKLTTLHTSRDVRNFFSEARTF